MKSWKISIAGAAALASVLFCSHVTASTESDPLMAAFRASDMTPPVGVPLAGFGSAERRLIPWDLTDKYPFAHYFKPSVGTLDPLRVKVLMLSRGGSRLLFIGVDLLALTSDITHKIYKKLAPLGFKKEEIFVSSTHTHSGFGALTKNPVWQVLAVDKFQPIVMELFLEKIFWTVNLAVLQLQPAELYTTSFLAPELHKNRRDKAHPEYGDHEANLLLVKSAGTGNWMGALVNYAIHPTTMRPSNLYYSADVAGSIEVAMQDRIKELNTGTPADPTVIFINGAEGDISPIHSGMEGRRTIAEQFTEKATPAIALAEPVDAHWSMTSGTIKLPSARLNLRACVNEKWLKPILWSKLALWLGWAMPRDAQFTHLRIGNITMMTWPGEPVTSLGLALKEEALKLGAGHAWILGLTNDYLGYFTTKQEFRAGGYEACSSLYTEKGGEILLKSQKALLQKSLRQ